MGYFRYVCLFINFIYLIPFIMISFFNKDIFSAQLFRFCKEWAFKQYTYVIYSYCILSNKLASGVSVIQERFQRHVP